MNKTYESGLRGLKQISKAMKVNGIGNFEEYTARFLDRCGFHAWWSR